MKNHLVRVSMLVLAATATWAQNPHPLRASVPFDFSVSGMTMPAGEYLVSQTSIADFITLHAGNGKNVMIQTVTAETAAPPVTARLVFHRYGDQCFSESIWVKGHNEGTEVARSHRERELARGNARPDLLMLMGHLR